MAHDSDPFSFSQTSLGAFPESMRAFAEKGFAQARDGYEKFKEAAEANNGAIEAAYQSATRGASDYATKLLEIAKTNTDEAFGFAQALLGSKSVPDAFELMNSHARRQFELLTSQSKDLVALSQKVATNTVEPIKTSAAKAFKTGL